MGVLKAAFTFTSYFVASSTYYTRKQYIVYTLSATLTRSGYLDFTALITRAVVVRLLKYLDFL